MSGIDPFDLVCPVQNLLTRPRVCAGCGGTLPPFAPFRDRPGRPDPHAACLKRLEAERIAKAEAALASALADWTMYRERYYAGQPLILAVLDIHRPIGDYAGPGCAECQQSDGMESTENVPWPCPTYTALARKPEPVNGCSAECGPVGMGETVEYEVPEGGIRSQYGVTFQPGEIQTVRAAASAAGKSTSAYLHDLAVDASSPVTVNITVQGGQPAHAAINKQLLAEYRAYPSPFRR